MADAPNDPAAGYYSGRPLNYDAQRAEAATAPQPAVGEQANNALPVAPQPPPDAGEQANHTHVHGVPGYYKGRVNRTVAAAVPQAAAAQAAAAPAPAPPPAAATIEPEKEQSCIKKLLMCFNCGKDKK